jgi:UDP-3-O-[3-hydroxymyristoyl] glucosamine N-acyltransferase
MTLRDIAAHIGAVVEGDAGLEVRRAAKIEEGEPGDIVFLANPKYTRHLDTTRATAVIVGPGVSLPAEPGRPALLRTGDPYAAFLRVLALFHPPALPVPPGIHPTAVVAPSARLGAEVRLGAWTVVGERAVLGDGVAVGHGTIIGDDTEIGPASILWHSVTVREGCRLGARVVLQPGVVIGGDGFGFAPRPDGSYEKIPQTGIVVIDDDVEIGANTTVDRATMGETRIRRGTKLDNLIMVAHNVVIGEHTVMAAQAGVSGSTKIGARSMVGGQAGITGHLELADGTQVGAQSGVHRSVSDPGQVLFGSPARLQHEAYRITAAQARVPDLLRTVQRLEERVRALEDACAGRPPAPEPDAEKGH